METSLSDYFPHISYYMFWNRKEKFLLYEDVYDEWTLFAVEDGSFHFEIGEMKGTAALGDIVLCPPGIRFRRVIISPLTFHYIRVCWEDAQGIHTNPADFAKVAPTGKIHIKHTDRLIADYMLLKNYNKLDEPSFRRRINHSLQDIWYMYCDECSRQFTEPGTLTPARAHDADPLMTTALERIDANAFEAFAIKDLAAALGITPTRFSRRFKERYGETPMEYLTSLRLEKAKTLLLETKMSLQHIAECCGYQNEYYFNRMFTKQYGITPGKFRRAHRV